MYCSGYEEIPNLYQKLHRFAGVFEKFFYFEEPNMNDWGHEKRAKGLMLSHSEYTGFFNDDDLYDLQYIEKLSRQAEESGADVVYCNFYTKHRGGGMLDSFPQLGYITSGNFLVRTELGRTVGYNHRVYEADGLFIEELVKVGATFSKVNECLYTHR